MLPPQTLRLLARGRWPIPVLAQINVNGGARFAALVGSLNVSRSVLSATLQDLQQSELILRNPGHGHPLRPEYVLTQQGVTVAAWCERVMEQRKVLGLEPDQLTRWSLPVVASLDRGWQRFSALKAELNPVSPRALSLTLKQMMSAELVGRRVEDGFPPHPLYGLTDRGSDLAAAMGR